jgi:hypothetical protein
LLWHTVAQSIDVRQPCAGLHQLSCGRHEQARLPHPPEQSPPAYWSRYGEQRSGNGGIVSTGAAGPSAPCPLQAAAASPFASTANNRVRVGMIRLIPYRRIIPRKPWRPSTFTSLGYAARSATTSTGTARLQLDSDPLGSPESINA